MENPEGDSKLCEGTVVKDYSISLLTRESAFIISREKEKSIVSFICVLALKQKTAEAVCDVIESA